MSHTSHSRVFSSTTRLLALIEIITGVPKRQFAKRPNRHVDRGSLSTNHKLASQNSSNADVSTAGLQFSSGQTSMQVQAKTENK